MDDYGLHPGVDEACHRLVDLGRIGALSVMADGPTWPSSARRLRSVSPEVLDVGLHLNFTECLGAAGPVWPLMQLLVRAPLRLLPRQAMRESIRRQLGGLVDALGRAPAHVDGHQHVQQLPVVRDLLLDELAQAMDRLGIPVGSLQAPWLRCGQAPRSPALPERRKAQIIEAFGARPWARSARSAGWRCSDYLLGVYGFDAGPARLHGLWRDWLALATPRDVIMCHPAAHTPVDDVIGAARRREFEWMTHPDFGRLLSEAGVVVRPWGQGRVGEGLQVAVGGT